MPRAWWIAASLFLLVACGSDDKPAPTVNVVNPCQQLADISVQLKCLAGHTRQDAVDACQTDQSESPAKCAAQQNAYNQCRLDEPAESFECSSSGDGTVVPQDTICATERDAFLSCALN